MASNSGCTEVLVEGASTPNLARRPSESVIGHCSRIAPISRENHAMTRDEYVEKLKAQIDQWNAQVKAWEAKAKQAQGKLREDYGKQLESVRAQRDKVMDQLRLVQNASVDAWSELMRGADQAWKSMQEAFERARSHFDKSGKR
jgi:uncharacterized coiled-coil DUF342 family protein